MFSDICGFIIDLDGVFFKDFQLLPGSKEFFSTLQQKAIPYVFLSNLTSKTAEEIHEILFRVGVYVDKDRIITSSSLVKDYLKEFYPDSTVKVYGSKALKSVIFQEYKFGVEEADVIVIGMDPKLTINDLVTIRQHIEENKEIIFTNPDYYSPTKTGYSIECGVIIELLKPHLKNSPQIIGKPSKYAFDTAVEKLNMPKEFIAVIGDRYETDIKGAIDFGMIPIHLQTTPDEKFDNCKFEAYEYKNLEEFCTHFNKDFN